MNYKLLNDPHFTQKLFGILLLLYIVCWVFFLLVVLWCGFCFVLFFGGGEWGKYVGFGCWVFFFVVFVFFPSPLCRYGMEYSNLTLLFIS